METVVRREQLKSLVLEAMISFLEDDVHGNTGAAAASKHTAIRRLPAQVRTGYDSSHGADHWWAECSACRT